MRKIPIALVVMLCLAAVSFADVPQMINFQGALKDADGEPVDSSVDLTFRIYNVATGGSPLWEELHIAVPIYEGIFNAELGGITPFPPDLLDSSSLWITFRVSGEVDEMSPRREILSVPYARMSEKSIQAIHSDTTNTISGVPIYHLVQQDSLGNVNIGGTMTATAFVGDGSGLTGITGIYDSLYIHATGPDTMTANSASPTLIIKNSGSGDGIHINSTGDDGIEISSSFDDGIDIVSAGGDGVLVESATDAGFYVINSGYAGFRVHHSLGHGVEIGSATTEGVYINSAGTDGVYIYNVGTPTTHNLSSAYNGFEVAGAEGNGLYVGRANTNGIFVKSAGDNGIQIEQAVNCGVRIDSTNGTGIFIHQAYNYGAYVNSAGLDGFYIGTAGNPTNSYPSSYYDGFEVAGAEGDGLYVGYTDRTGVNVNSAAIDGVYIGSASDDGIEVASAAEVGVYANTTNGSNEWGFDTPDKIRCLSITYSRTCMNGKNEGNTALEPGDIVCLTGYEENVFGDSEIPIIKVAKANENNSEAVIGVVEYRVAIEEKIEKNEAKKGEVRKTFRFAEGNANFGDYISIITDGPADVKVDSRENITTGQKLTVSGNTGKARSIKKSDNWTIGILGKALEDSNGKDKMKVFVNCK